MKIRHGFACEHRPKTEVFYWHCFYLVGHQGPVSHLLPAGTSMAAMARTGKQLTLWHFTLSRQTDITCTISKCTAFQSQACNSFKTYNCGSNSHSHILIKSGQVWKCWLTGMVSYYRIIFHGLKIIDLHNDTKNGIFWQNDS